MDANSLFDALNQRQTADQSKQILRLPPHMIDPTQVSMNGMVKLDIVGRITSKDSSGNLLIEIEDVTMDTDASSDVPTVQLPWAPMPGGD